MATYRRKTADHIEAVRLESEFGKDVSIRDCFSEQPDWLGELIAGARIVPRRAPDNSAFTGEDGPEWEGVTVATGEGPRHMMVGDYLVRGDLGQVHVTPADIFESVYKSR